MREVQDSEVGTEMVNREIDPVWPKREIKTKLFV